jgi:hypothetical protein
MRANAQYIPRPVIGRVFSMLWSSIDTFCAIGGFNGVIHPRELSMSPPPGKTEQGHSRKAHQQKPLALHLATDWPSIPDER